MWQALSTFVETVCEGRDASHGHDHMKKVACNALYIYENTDSELKNEHVYNLVITTAWLHDVNDHKYKSKNDLTDQINEFLRQYYNESDTQLILNIIDRISFSKENKAKLQNQELDWQEVLGVTGCFVRDIVSDADKLEALGKIGIERCIGYTKHLYFEKNNKEISQEEVEAEVIKHCNEKLLLLKDHFIRTDAGKEMATPLHNETVEFLAEFIIK